jgi:hypothetical protein
MPAIFTIAPSGARVALEADHAAGARHRRRGAVDDILALRIFHAAQVLRDGLAGDGDAVAVQEAGVEQLLHHHLDAADAIEVGRGVLAARHQVADIGRLAEDLAHVLEVELDPRLVRDRRQVQARVGRAAGRGDDHGGVLERLARDDVARAAGRA